MINNPTFHLPQQVAKLVEARNALRERYRDSGLMFTPDGKLVGDLGEAVAAELFDLTLAKRGNEEGVDAWTKGADRKSVQIKATGSGKGKPPGFRDVEHPKHVLLLRFDYEGLSGEVLYNGPFQYVLGEWERKGLPAQWREKENYRGLTANEWSRLNLQVDDSEQLPIADKSLLI